MISRQIPEHKALALRSLLQATLAGHPVQKDGFFSIQAKKDVLLVEPVNSAPYIFRSPDVVFIFESKPGSGTDFLRQRVIAQNFFDNITSDNKEQNTTKTRRPG